MKENKLLKIKEIEFYCNLNQITNYTINDDYSVDVNGTVILSTLKEGKIPFKFAHIKGSFIADSLNLETLDNAPNSVDGDFSIKYNKLKNLIGSPKSCNSFVANNNLLENVEGITQKINKFCDLGNNQLTSIKGMPKIYRTLDLHENLLNDLDEVLDVGNNVDVGENPLLNLAQHGWPHNIGNKMTFFVEKNNAPPILMEYFMAHDTSEGAFYHASLENELIKSIVEKNHLNQITSSIQSNRKTLKI